jgi:hypothetical protein
MMPKIVVTIMWFPLSLILLIICCSLLIKPQKNNMVSQFVSPANTIIGIEKFPDNHQTGQVLGVSIKANDGRTVLLNRFLSGSPLENYADYFISEADKYNLDFRLVPAIAMCESNLGKHIPSSDSYNAYGIAVYTGQNHGAKFGSWNESISWVSKFIHDKFMKKNIVDIKEIGAIWAPPSVEKGHSWANCVETFMRKIE